VYDDRKGFSGHEAAYMVENATFDLNTLLVDMQLKVVLDE